MEYSAQAQLIDMWSALENHNVVVSYPEKQPSANPTNIVEQCDLETFKKKNEFYTFYDFGPYTITHSETKHRYNALVRSSVRFNLNGKFVCCVLDKRGYFDKPVDKDFYNLYLATKGKAENPNKPIENPFKLKISTNISEIKEYALNAFDAESARKVIEKLTDFETALQRMSPNHIHR
jgi:hypothetical protein